MASELQTAQEAWERGDYAQAKRQARAALASETDADARKLAEEILGRTRSDRAAVVLGAACLVFFLVVVVSFVGHG